MALQGFFRPFHEHVMDWERWFEGYQEHRCDAIEGSFIVPRPEASTIFASLTCRPRGLGPSSMAVEKCPVMKTDTVFTRYPYAICC